MNDNVRGMIFDIKEFSTNDGEGIRTTIFFKGCPLRCIWCHNPEGIRRERQLFIKRNGCISCGRCRNGCTHTDCIGLGRCIHICPMGLVEAVGEEIYSDELAKRVMRGADILLSSGGGVTISGGEPLMQPEFAIALFRSLNIHKAIETSGYAQPDIFAAVINECDFVFLDIKIADREKHKIYTGVYNDLILQNYDYLRKNKKHYMIRIPLIPGITDTDENLKEISAIIDDSPAELIPYNRFAGVKYPNLGLEFTYKFIETKNEKIDLSIFKSAILRSAI